MKQILSGSSKTTKAFFFIGLALLLFVLFCVSVSVGGLSDVSARAEGEQAEITYVEGTVNGVTLRLENPKIKSSTGFQIDGYALSKDLSESTDFTDIAESFATTVTTAYSASSKKNSRFYEVCQMFIPIMMIIEDQNYDAATETVNVPGLYLVSDAGKSTLKRYSALDSSSPIQNCDFNFYTTYDSVSFASSPSSLVKDVENSDYWNYGYKCSNPSCVYYTQYAGITDIMDLTTYTNNKSAWHPTYHNYLASDPTQELSPYLNNTKLTEKSMEGKEESFVQSGQLKNNAGTVTVTPANYYSETCIVCPTCGSVMASAASNCDILTHNANPETGVSGASGIAMNQQKDGVNIFYKWYVSSIQISGTDWMGNAVKDMTIYSKTGSTSSPLAGVYYISKLQFGCDIQIPYFDNYTYTIVSYKDGFGDAANVIRKYMVETKADCKTACFTASSFSNNLTYTYTDYTFPLILSSSITVADRAEFADNLIGDACYNGSAWSDKIMLHDSSSSGASYAGTGSFAYSNKNTSYSLFSIGTGVVSGGSVGSANLASIADYLELVWFTDDSASKKLRNNESDVNWTEKTKNAGDYYLSIFPEESLRMNYKYAIGERNVEYPYSIVYVKQATETAYVPNVSTCTIAQAKYEYELMQSGSTPTSDQSLKFYMQPFSIDKIPLNFDLSQEIGMKNNEVMMEEYGEQKSYVKEHKKTYTSVTLGFEDIGIQTGDKFSDLEVFSLKTGVVFSDAITRYKVEDESKISISYNKATVYHSGVEYYYKSEEEGFITMKSLIGDLSAFGYRDGDTIGSVKYYMLEGRSYALATNYAGSGNAYFYRNLAEEFGAVDFFNALHITSVEDWVAIGGIDADYAFYQEHYEIDSENPVYLLSFTGSEFPSNQSGSYDYIYLSLSIQQEIVPTDEEVTAGTKNKIEEADLSKIQKNYYPVFIVDSQEASIVEERSTDSVYVYKYEKEDSFKLVPRAIVVSYEMPDSSAVYGDYFTDADILTEYFKLDEETAELHVDNVLGEYYTLTDNDPVELGDEYGINELEWIIKIVSSSEELVSFDDKNVVYIIPRFYQNVEDESSYTHKSTDYIRKALTESDPIDVDIITDYFKLVTEGPLLPYVENYNSGMYFIGFSVEIVPGKDSTGNNSYEQYTTSWGNGLTAVQPVGSAEVSYTESNTNRLVNSCVALRMDTPFKMNVSGLSIYFRTDDLGYITRTKEGSEEKEDIVEKVYDGTKKAYTATGEEATVTAYLLRQKKDGITIGGKKYSSILEYDLENNFYLTATLAYDSKYSGDKIQMTVVPSEGNKTCLTPVANATARQKAILGSYLYESTVDEKTGIETVYSVYYKLQEREEVEKTKKDPNGDDSPENTISITYKVFDATPMDAIGKITQRDVMINILYDVDKITDTEDIMYTTGDYSRTYLGMTGVALRLARYNESTTEENEGNRKTLLDVYLEGFDPELHGGYTKNEIETEYQRFADYYYVYYIDSMMGKVELGYMFYGDLLLYGEMNDILFLCLEISKEDGEGFLNDEGFTWSEKDTYIPYMDEDTGKLEFDTKSILPSYAFKSYVDIQFMNDNNEIQNLLEAGKESHDFLNWLEVSIASPTGQKVEFNVDSAAANFYYIYIDSEYLFVNYKLNCNGKFTNPTTLNKTIKYICVEVKKAFVPEDAFTVNEQLASNEEYLVYNTLPHTEKLVWETDSDIELAESYVHIDYRGHDEVRLPGNKADNIVRFEDPELGEVITDYKNYLAVIEYSYLLADGTYSEPKNAAADIKIANMTYAGKYKLSLTLPETANYYESAPFYFNIVVSCAKVYVYSTVASRKYMDTYDKDKEISFADSDYIIVNGETELDGYLGGINLNSGEIVDTWTDSLVEEGYAKIYLYKEGGEADEKKHTVIYAYDSTPFPGFTGEDSVMCGVEDIALKLTGGDFENYTDNICQEANFITYKEGYCRNFTFVYPGDNYFCRTLYIWAQELNMQLEYYQEKTYSGRSVTPTANIFNESGIEMELSETFAISQYIAGYSYVKNGKLILLDNTGIPLIFESKPDDAKANAHYFFKDAEGFNCTVYYRDDAYYYLDENDAEQAVSVTLFASIHSTTGAFGTVTVGAEEKSLFLSIDVQNKSKIDIEDVYAYTEYSWTFKDGVENTIYFYYKEKGSDKEYVICKDDNGYYLEEDPSTYITMRFLGTIPSNMQVANAVIHSEEKEVYIAKKDKSQYDSTMLRNDVTIAQEESYDGCYLVYVNVQIDATGSSNYKPSSDVMIMIRINKLEIAFDRSESNIAYHAEKYYDGLVYTIETFDNYFMGKDSGILLAGNEFANAYSWANIYVKGFRYYDCFNLEIELSNTLKGEADNAVFQNGSKMINAGVYQLTLVAELKNNNIFINDANVTMVGNTITFQTYLAVKRYGDDPAEDSLGYTFNYTYVGEYREKTDEALYMDYSGTFGQIGYTLSLPGVGGGYVSNNGELVGVTADVSSDYTTNIWKSFFVTKRTYESTYVAQAENDITTSYYSVLNLSSYDYLNYYLVNELVEGESYGLYSSGTVFSTSQDIKNFDFLNVKTINDGIAFSIRFTINPKSGCTAQNGGTTYNIYDNNYATKQITVHVIISKKTLYVTPKCIDENGSNKVYGETNKSAEGKFTMEFLGFAEGDEEICLQEISGQYPVINWKNLPKDQYQSTGKYKISGKIGSDTLELKNYEYDFSGEIEFEVLACIPEVEVQQYIEYQGKAVTPTVIRYGFDGTNLDESADDKLGTSQRKVECVGVLLKNQKYSYTLFNEDETYYEIGANGIRIDDIHTSNFLKLSDEQGNRLDVNEIGLLDNTVFEPLGSSKDVGYYLYKVTLGSSQNYTEVPPTYYIVEITKKTLDLYMINGGTNTRGQGSATKIYDKKTDNYPDFTVEYSGFVGNDTKTLGGDSYYATVSFLHQTDLETYVGTKDQAGTGDLNGILINPLYVFVNQYGEEINNGQYFPVNVTTEGYFVKLIVNDEELGCGLASNYTVRVQYYVEDKTTMYPNLQITSRYVQVQYNNQTCAKISKVYDGKTTVDEDSISSENYEFIAVEGEEESGLVEGDTVYLSFIYGMCRYNRSDVYRDDGAGNFIKDDITVYTYVNTDLFGANNVVNMNYKLYWKTDNHCIELCGVIEQASASVVFYSDAEHTSPARSQILTTYTGDMQEVYPIVHGVEDENSPSGYEEFTIGTDYAYRYYSEEIKYDSTDIGATPAPKNCATYIFELSIKNESIRSLNYKASVFAIYLIIQKTSVDIVFSGDPNQNYGEIAQGLSAKAKGVGDYTKDIDVKYYASYKKAGVSGSEGKTIGYIDSLEGFSDEVESIAQADAGVYYAVAYYESTTNFLEGYAYEEFTVSRKKIVGNFNYSQVYRYTGSTPLITYYITFENQKMTPDLLFNRIENGEAFPYNYEIVDGEIVNVTKDYPVDVGDYQVKPNITSIDNFIVTGCDWVDFSITKADLVVSIVKKTIKEGQTYTPTYSIKGKLTEIDDSKLFSSISFRFYNAETGEELDKEPTKAGIYKVEPYDVACENYNVTCVAGNLEINKNVIAAKVENKGVETGNSIVIDGSFASDLVVNITEKQNTEQSEIKRTFDSFKENNTSFASYKLTTVFEFEFENFTYSTENDQEFVIKLYLPDLINKFRGAENAFASFIYAEEDEGGLIAEEGKCYVAVLYQNGSMEIVEAEVSDDYLSVGTNNLQIKALSFLSTEAEEVDDSMDWVLYVCIAIAVAIIALTVVFVVRRKGE